MLNNIKFIRNNKRESLIKSFHKSVQSLRGVNSFKNFIFLLTDEEGVILELVLPYGNANFSLKKSMILKEEIAGTNAVSLAIREKKR